MELYILRHGTTEWNVTGRFQGCNDIPLNENGRRLALILSQALADVPIDAAVTSPLCRAQETAHLVLGERDGKVPFLVDERIREYHFGELEGLATGGPHPQVTSEVTAQYFDLAHPDNRVPGGDSLRDVIDRAASFMEEILNKKEWEDKRILVSTHGCMTRALLHTIWQDQDFWHGCVPPNCSISIVKAQNGRVTDLEQDHLFYDPSEATPMAYKL